MCVKTEQLFVKTTYLQQKDSKSNLKARSPPVCFFEIEEQF